MRLEFIDLSDVLVSQQNVIDGDHTLVLEDRVTTNDFGAGSVVTSSRRADGRELVGLTLRDRLHTVLITEDVGKVEGGEDFAREHLKEEGFSIASPVNLTDTGQSCVRHLVSPCKD